MELYPMVSELYRTPFHPIGAEGSPFLFGNVLDGVALLHAGIAAPVDTSKKGFCDQERCYDIVYLADGRSVIQSQNGTGIYPPGVNPLSQSAEGGALSHHPAVLSTGVEIRSSGDAVRWVRQVIASGQPEAISEDDIKRLFGERFPSPSAPGKGLPLTAESYITELAKQELVVCRVQCTKTQTSCDYAFTQDELDRLPEDSIPWLAPLDRLTPVAEQGETFRFVGEVTEYRNASPSTKAMEFVLTPLHNGRRRKPCPVFIRKRNSINLNTENKNET